MEPSIRDIDAQQLRAALNDENKRIEGANIVRQGIRILAYKIGFFGTMILMFPVHKQVLCGELCLILWAGCWWLFHVTKPQPLHYFDDNGWEDDARTVLLQALEGRNRRYMAEREAEHRAG